MTTEHDLSELVALRALVASKDAVGPVEPELVVDARRQIADLQEVLAITSGAIEQYRIERHIEAIYRAITPVSREFEHRRRQHQRATDEARRHLQHAVATAYEERRERALERIERSLGDALTELESLEEARTQLDQQFAPTGVSQFANTRLLQMLRDALRYRNALAEASPPQDAARRAP